MVQATGKMPVIAVTGANGFVGQPLLHYLAARGNTVLPVVRPGRELPGFSATRQIGDILDVGAWAETFAGADVVVHLLSLAHNNHSRQSIDEVNHRATVAVAQGAIKAGVKRFVFVSTAHVFGINSSRDVVSDEHRRNPNSAYAEAKCRAEDELQELGRQFADGLAILRPPLIYGENPKGNILKLVRALQRGIPLPFASLGGNKRSMIDLRNFHDAIHTCTQSDKSGAYLVCDAAPVSIPEMISALAMGAGVTARLLPFPTAAFTLLSHMPFVGGIVAKMTGPLVYDCSRFCRDFHWSPGHETQEGLRLAAASVSRI